MDYLHLYTDTPHLQTMWQPLIIIYIMIVLLYGWRPVYRGGVLLKCADDSSSKQLLIYFVLIWIVAVFGVTAPDYWSYMKMNIGFYPDRIGNTYEPIYLFLVRTISDYTLWRALVWGTSSILMIFTIKKASVSVTSALLFTTLLYISSFYAFRNVLGFSILYYALTLWCKPEDIHIVRNRIIAVMLALISLLCHNTMVITLLIVIISAKSISLKRF